MKHRTPQLRAPALAALAIALGATATAAGGAPAVVADAAAGRAATLLFISVSTGHAAAPDVAALRIAGERALGRIAARLGHVPADAAAVAGAQRGWRVRNALGLTRGFLAALRDEAGADHLLVGQAFVYPGRLLLTARDVRTADGLLTWSDVAETGAPAGGEGWEEPFTRLADTFGGAPAPASGPPALLVLPARIADVEPLAGDILTACLLRELLASGRGPVLDPGLLTGELRSLGRSAAALDSAACGAVRRAFGPLPLLVPEVLSWESTALLGALPPPEAGGAGLRPAEGEVVAALRAVDTATLALRDRREVHCGPIATTGWFGARRVASPLGRYRGAAAALLAGARFD